MSNNIVFAICQALAQQSIGAFRFNFRGVGESEGTFGEGVAEQEDVEAALALTMSTKDIDSARVGLAGYSFGASVALPVAIKDERVSLLALVSPALSDSGWEKLKGYLKTIPKGWQAKMLRQRTRPPSNTAAEPGSMSNSTPV